MARSRYISLGIALVLVALIAGYVGSSVNGDGSSSSGSAVEKPGAWIKKIKESGELRVACADSPPTSAVKSDGTCDGPVLLPFKELASALGVKFVNVGTTYQSIIAGLQAGKYDIAANIDATMKRTLAVQFTVPGWTYQGVFLLPRKDAGRLTSTEAILKDSKPVSTAQGTSFDQALARLKPAMKPLLLPGYQDAAQAVKAGRSSALFTDTGSASSYAKGDKSFCIYVPDPVLVTNSVVNGLTPDVDAFSMQTVNFAINDSVDQGRFGAAMKEAGYLSESELGDLRC